MNLVRKFSSLQLTQTWAACSPEPFMVTSVTSLQDRVFPPSASQKEAFAPETA